MNKKKLIEYTRLIRPIARKKGLLSASQLVELFLSEYPNFFDDPEPLRTSFGGPIRKTAVDEPNPVKESFDELFEARENQSQTGSFEITFKITK